MERPQGLGAPKEDGESRGDAVRRLFSDIYPRLHVVASRLLRHERPGHTLQATAVVHEVFLRLVEQGSAGWRDAEHLIGVGVEMLRRVLIDHARGRLAVKRGGRYRRVGIVAAADRADHRPWIDLIALDDAVRRLQEINPRMGRIAVLHLYGGLNHEQAARVLEVGRTTVAIEWMTARAWLTRDLRGVLDADPR